MKSTELPEVCGIQSILYGAEKTTDRVYVYLHGAGEFGQGAEGQYQYPGFATLLRDGNLSLKQPLIIACCMAGTHWLPDALKPYLDEVSAHFGHAQIDLIGYSRGGEGIYALLSHLRNPALRTATIINSAIPPMVLPHPTVPLHVIHASQDQFTSLANVKDFVGSHTDSNIKLTEWQGDHFSIEAIARSGVWKDWFELPK
ncbi:hypothetical protein [Photobacterium sp. TY1-4]|uniref:hypothetical protein n=1 Tax=Photobacterium sp. TY1-4 TaxID=2899122 RepID=UPI0021C0807E|nr:hypothetical protein [Photobacterium sp. TY1-4]UXI00114.1 hypothetical protein NH461_09780 [Photobacterium sp. TY1-4]